MTQWLTVAQTAQLLGTSEEMVRRKIREGELPASRLTEAARAPWMIDAEELQRQIMVDKDLERVRESGIVTGSGEPGTAPFEEFIAENARRHGAGFASAVREVATRVADAENAARTVAEIEAGFADEFAALDEAEREEAIARELARRWRRSERIHQRALEIFNDDDDEQESK